MRLLCKAAVALSAAASLAACDVHTTAFPERGPAPPPPPGYRAVCSTSALPFYTFSSTCTPVRDTTIIERRVVVRAKG